MEGRIRIWDEKKLLWIGEVLDIDKEFMCAYLGLLYV